MSQIVLLANEDGDNVCFINAAVQLLRSDPAIRACAQETTSTEDDETWKAMMKLITTKEMKASSFIMAISIDLRFEFGLQHDCHEFLVYILNKAPQKFRECFHIQSVYSCDYDSQTSLFDIVSNEVKFDNISDGCKYIVIHLQSLDRANRSLRKKIILSANQKNINNKFIVAISVVLKDGNLARGHYINAQKYNESKWIVLNDDECTQYTEEQIINQMNVHHHGFKPCLVLLKIINDHANDHDIVMIDNNKNKNNKYYLNDISGVDNNNNNNNNKLLSPNENENETENINLNNNLESDNSKPNETETEKINLNNNLESDNEESDNATNSSTTENESIKSQPTNEYKALICRKVRTILKKLNNQKKKENKNTIYYQAKDYVKKKYSSEYEFNIYDVSQWLKFSPEFWKQANKNGTRNRVRNGYFISVEKKSIKSCKAYFRQDWIFCRRF